MKKQKFLFIGNRKFVLEQMIQEDVEIVGIGIIANTHLARDYANSAMPLSNICIIHSKQEALDFIHNNTFDVLISNGCPYILPVNDLPQACYANIHPSYLPDLKGIDPTIGAVLHKRDTGATCHIMDMGIDTGKIISQVKIPYSDDIDVTTLYQLSFHAEKEAFKKALALNFEPQKKQEIIPNAIYYNRCAQDMNIDFSENNDLILQKVKAFNNKSIGCSFSYNNTKFKVFTASKMVNPYVRKVVMGHEQGVVALSYENCIIFHKDNEVLRFSEISLHSEMTQGKGVNELLCVGTKLF